MAIWIEGKAFVPEISDILLNKLIKKIVPVIRKEDKLYNIELPDLRHTAYTWDTKLKDEHKDLIEVARIKTDHYCGYYGFFKPSVAEVIAQIPEGFINKICAFEILADMDSGTEDEVKIYSDGNGHQATTILYGRKLSDKKPQ
jgi:hypothetical protein